MKYNRLLLIFFCAAAIPAVSQDYHRLKFGMGIGYLPAGNLKSGGLTYFEPAYRINKAFALGLKLELATGLLSRDGGLAFMGSYSLNGQYYFLNGKIRPYLGAGIGLYSPARTGSLCDCSETIQSNVPGIYPRIGFDYGHFVFAVEYNFIRNARVTTTSIIPANDAVIPSVSYLKSSYLSTKFGFYLGGGRRKKGAN